MTAALDLLRAARESYSQRQIAEALGVNDRTVARWEAGNTSIPSLAVPALKEFLRLGRTSSAPRAFTFVDLFAGIGGIRTAFERIGGECVFTSEWDRWAQQTYKANFPDDEYGEHVFAGDITAVEASAVPDHDVLVGGFPCQPFSIAGVSKKNALGRAHGFADATQGTLFFDVARIIDEKRPAAFLLENVKNLKSHDKGRTFEVIRATLQEELGYELHTRVINGKHFTPQNRERIILVGFREGSDFDFDELALEDYPSTVRDVLHKPSDADLSHDGGRFVDPTTGRVNDKYTLTDHLWTYLQNYAAKHRAAGNGFGFGLVDLDGTTRTLSARYYKDGSEILIPQTGRNPRRLTPRECARLMGFDDDFVIPVSDTQAYKQFGNSVVVPAISAVAELMAHHISPAARSVSGSLAG
ncbi:DNA (cytosine-5-)-methyltransferase [Aeromicrobium sp. 179-A 4D2 NHS]|uniref:DNA (cytosine-5-)-methyltransferase n=1 Tax=Aeromicrobium sp. 179-A 4D2 NHS TaxID=3142375 RepID=UPI0039A10BAD